MSRALRLLRRLGLATLLLLTLLAGAPAHAQERTSAASGAEGAPAGLKVQKTWRLLAVGLDVDPRLRARPLLRLTERALRRELPGLDMGFERAG